LTIADKIIEYRAAHNLTQKEFAALADVSERTLMRVMRGTGKAVTVKKIELAMGGGESRKGSPNKPAKPF